MVIDTQTIREAIKCDNSGNPYMASVANQMLDAIEGLLQKWNNVGETLKKMWEEEHLKKFEVNVRRYADKTYTVMARDADDALDKAVSIGETDASFEKEYHYYMAQFEPFGDED